MINRRNFLKNASLFTLGGLMAGKAGDAVAAQSATAFVASKAAVKNIGLQIYSLGNELYEDVPEGMKKLKKMGYQTIELAGYGKGKIRDIELMDFKKMATDAGISILSSHVNPPVYEYTKNNLNTIKEFWKKTADDHAKLGVKYLVQPGQPSTRNVEETKYVCEVFNEVGEIVKAAGIPFGYHNHDMEFAKVVSGGKEMKFGRNNKGEKVYDIFFSYIDPSLVFFEMDVYWAVMGQQDPVEYLTKYADRIKVLHIKDRYVLGDSGMMNFEQIFKHFYVNGHKDFFVEMEGTGSGHQFEGVRKSADYLLKSSFVK